MIFSKWIRRQRVLMVLNNNEKGTQWLQWLQWLQSVNNCTYEDINKYELKELSVLKRCAKNRNRKTLLYRGAYIRNNFAQSFTHGNTHGITHDITHGITQGGSRKSNNIRSNIYRYNYVEKENCFRLFAKMPVMTVNRKLYPKPFSTDYENILRKFDVTYINYKTRLRGKKEIDIRAIDDLYGKIYDRNVLKKQFYFFLYNDDINTCYHILNENRNVLTKEESFKILNSLPYVFYVHLEYHYPNEQNVDTILKKLLKTYIFQYANDKNIDFLNFHYRYNELDEYCQQLQKEFDLHKEETAAKEGTYGLSDGSTSEGTNVIVNEKKKEQNIYDDDGDTDYAKKYKHYKYNYDIIESTKKFKDLMKKFENYPTNIKLEKVQQIYTKILTMKASKLYEGFYKHESIKRNEQRKLYRNAKLKLDTHKLSPYMNEPVKVDLKKKEQVNKLFAKYVEEKDLKNACLIIRKYTNLIDTKEERSRELIKEFLKLHEYIYKCNKYNEKELAFLRMIYFSTVRKHRVVVKICEVGLREQGENVTHKEVYEKQLNDYIKKRNKLFDEKMKEKNIDMEKIRDFSSAYPMEWLPVLYKNLFEEVEKEKNLKSLGKEVLKKKKDSIMEMFSSDTAKRMRKGEMEKEVKEKEKDIDTEKGKEKDEQKQEEDTLSKFKIKRVLLNYKKIERGKKKKQKGGKKQGNNEENQT